MHVPPYYAPTAPCGPPQAGLSNVPTPGSGAGAGRSCITTANSISRPPRYGSPKHVCYSTDSPIEFDYVYTLQEHDLAFTLDKRIFDDPGGKKLAANETPFQFQTHLRGSGEVINDLPMPSMIGG